MEKEAVAQKLKGRVISKSGDKTVGVLVERYVKHPKYQKFFTRSKKYLVHDEENSAEVGDKVVIVPTRPLSKRKTFQILTIDKQV